MKKILLSLCLVLAVFIGSWTISSADFNAPQPFYKSGAAWIMNKSTETLGNSANRIAEIWVTTLNATTATIAGASGNLDMGGYAITNGGTITGTTVNATSTTATSTFATGVQVGGGSLLGPSISFINDSNTGIWNESAESIGFVAQGVQRFKMTTLALTGPNTGSAYLSSPAGTVSIPAYTFSGDTNLGMYRIGTDILGFATAGADRMAIDATGNVGIASSTPWKTFSVVGTGAWNGLTNAPATASSICIDATTNELYDNAASSCLVSALRYKYDVKDQETAMEKIMMLKPRMYKSKSDNSEHYGFIAEEVEEVDKRFVDYNKDGTTQSVRYQEMVSLTVKAIQELKAENNALKARIEALENK